MSLCLCLLGAGVTGCIKDDEVAGQKETTLTLRFSTGANAPDQDGTTVGPELPNEHMRTLRVIVARSASNEILFNNVYGIEPEETSKTITYSELTINPDGENFDFYAIANEAGFLNTGESLEGITTPELLALKDRILNNKFNVNPAVSIPQTALETFWVGRDAEQTQDIQLEFVVTKVYVGFVNQTGAEQTITDLTLQASNPEQGYLFNPNDANRIPSGVTYDDLLIARSVPVAANATEDTPGVYAYLYPGNSTGQNAYVLQGSWNGSSKTVDVKALAGDALASGLQRGHQLNIIITLLGGEHEYTVNALVNTWGVKDMDIPDFY